MMKPKLEDLIFFDKYSIPDDSRITSIHSQLSHTKSRPHNRRFKNKVISAHDDLKKLDEKISDETMVEMIIHQLKGTFFPKVVQYFKSNYNDMLNKSLKNSQKSVKARIKANRLFAKENHDIKVHEDIWRLYCNSVAFAPIDSKELALAYESRSNLLLHFKKYDDCVKDIDRALTITEFVPLKVKLLCRKMTCFVSTDVDIDEKMKLWLSIKSHFEQIDGALKDDNFMKMLKQAKNDSLSEPTEKNGNDAKSSIPLVSFPNIVLKNDKEICVLANRDFLPGEEVIVTKPLFTSTNLNKSHAYCSHCLSFMWAGIPCDKCSLCMYCSEECKAKAWDKYHSWECKVLPHINFDKGVFYYLQMTIRIFMVGLSEFGSISKLREEIGKLNGNSISSESSELLDSDFLNFYITPSSYVNDIPFMSSYAKNACFLAAYIIQSCDIFEKSFKSMKGKELSKNKDVVFCTLIIFKALISTINNSVRPYQEQIVPKCCTGMINSDSKLCCHKGLIFHPFHGMIVKSCNPNVAKCWTDDGKLIYLCSQPIKKMEEITVCSSYEFYIVGAKHRMRGLQLICKCVACKNDWPALAELGKKFHQRKSKLKCQSNWKCQSDLNSKERNLALEALKMNIEKKEIDKTVEADQFLTESELQEFAKAVNDVVKVCSQPSYQSSMMINGLVLIYGKLHGTIPLQSHIPKDC